ncbi:MASE1 domain-containing protein [Thermasporomyces composti]|uniref:Integral membrane sensor domain MASE1 n=1 Tax=Thermasporomyces composti TaxID=696763 RepID=A0A3D9VEY3_THECX|nr:MASE1 domain-containing protein [Thermasporomyces composti]REF36704.1 integral membrane sensor domain MASE1 [Thermasporomyces composti]
MVEKPPRRKLSGAARTLVWIALLAGGYYALGLLALQEEIGGVETRLLWAPTGLSLAALLYLGPRVWPGIWFGSMLINVSLERPIVPSFLIATGTTVGLLCAYWLMRRAGFRNEIDRVRDVLALIGLGAGLGMAIGVTLNTTVLTTYGIGVPLEYLPRWFDVWTYFALGVLVGTPIFLVLWQVFPIRRIRLLRAIEAVALLGCTVLAALLATNSAQHPFYLVFPVMIWAGLRFGLPMVAPCAVVASTMVIVAAEQGHEAFAGESDIPREALIQAFIASLTLTGMVLSAAIRQRDAAHAEVERTATELVGVIHQLDRRLRPRITPPRRAAESLRSPPELTPGPRGRDPTTQ